ncbi:serine/threonine protein kinase [Salpingoeca rosetta]|uniref:Serine/threonine protein kinase n=1 Tax=Salpingoeca rosetta (strain ATCC 50818 / BSB-021) TaxID=946362 RepID=F2USN9_SALR5|nr:serine/threonine protein kinase [Salpingoeca rosetta]EGD81148.1 serine/threonine protein kinase [Salpingoeca rosetta]|eukprot:XP_004987833.1 serine/threonine protein kinase [Salpingoeca rosetta]
MTAAQASTPGEDSNNSTAMSSSEKGKTKEPELMTSLSTNDAGVLARAYLQAATDEFNNLLGDAQLGPDSDYHTSVEQIKTIAAKYDLKASPVSPKYKAKNYVKSLLEEPYTQNIKNLLQQVRSVLDEKKQIPMDDVEDFLQKLDNVTRKGLSEEQRQFRQALESSVTPSSAAKEKEKDKDSAHRTVYAQPFSAELLCPNWHLHNEGFQRAVDQGTKRGFGFLVPKRETLFNDRMQAPLIRACGDAKVDVKSHASFESDPAVVADYVVRLMSNYFFYPLLLELKIDDSKQTQDAAKAQVLEYASRAIKSAGSQWRALKGYLFPFAITVCGKKVSVYACTLGDEVHGDEAFPSVLHTKLCDTDLEKLGNVIEWLLDEEHMAHYENISAIAQGRLSTLEEHPNENGNATTSSASTSDKEEAAQSESPPPPPQQQHAQAPGTKTATGKTKPKSKPPRKQQQRQQAKGDRPITRSVSRVSQTRGTGRSDSGKKKARPSTAQRRQQAGRSRSPTPPQRQRQHAQAAGSPTTPATVPKHTKAATKTDTADSSKQEQHQLAVTKAARARSARVAARYEMCVFKGGKKTVSVALVNGEVLKVCGGHEIGAANEASNERKGWQHVYPEEPVKVHERSRPVFACPDLSNHITVENVESEDMDDGQVLEAAAEYLLRLSKRDLCHCDIRSHNILRNGCIVDFGFLHSPVSDPEQKKKKKLPKSYSTKLRERPRKWLLGKATDYYPKVVLDWESLLFSYVFWDDSVANAMFRLLQGKVILLEWLDAKLDKLDKDEKQATAALQDKSDDDKKEETAALQDKSDEDKKEETAALQDKSDDDKKEETAALLRNIMQHIACAYF